MRIKWLLLIILLVLVCCIIYTWCNQHRPDETPPGSITGLRDTSSYKKDEVMVVFKRPPTAAQINAIKAAYLEAGLRDSIRIQKCSECDEQVQLWSATNIETYISAEGVRAGSSGTSKGAGEDSIARYSLNYISSFPNEINIPLKRVDSLVRGQGDEGSSARDTVIIAVMDTGIDSMLIEKNRLWQHTADLPNGTDDDNNCLKDDYNGWNFTNGTANLQDDNPAVHGTIVTKYILNQFDRSARNFVQIMTLKTHDSRGRADLFKTICAIHYAIGNGAHIINASWGFYNYDANPLPYLDSLITRVLPRHGILFFAAAGNKIPLNDSLANERYKVTHGGASVPNQQMLRDLAINSFYPACLSNGDNNVITVTTTDSMRVSPTQNFSSEYVDLGIKADSADAEHMFFKQPFISRSFTQDYISGSSFATPIAAGRIGASFDVSLFAPGINKADLFRSNAATGTIVISTPLKSANLVREGRFSKHVP